MDCSPPDSSVHGIFQARILQWVAIDFSRVSSQLRDWICISCLAGRSFTTETPGKPLSHTVWAAAAKLLQCPTLCYPIDGAHQALLSLGFSKQEYWSGLPFPSPMHGSEKGKWSRSGVSDSSWPHGLQSTRLLHPWDFPGKSTGVGCHCLLQPCEQEVANILETLVRHTSEDEI